MQPPQFISRFFEWRWSGAVLLVGSSVLFLALIVAIIPEHIDLPNRDRTAAMRADRPWQSASEPAPHPMTPVEPIATAPPLRLGSPPRPAPSPVLTQPMPEPTAPSEPPLDAPARRHRHRHGQPLDLNAAGDPATAEQPPMRTAQPYPEAARIDPPLPPMRVPPEMIGTSSVPLATAAMPAGTAPPVTPTAPPAITTLPPAPTTPPPPPTATDPAAAPPAPAPSVVPDSDSGPPVP